jgi:hypothetical protein
MKIYYAQLSGNKDRLDEAEKDLDDLNNRILRDTITKGRS